MWPALQQNLDALSYGIRCLFTQGLLGIAGNGVGDNGKRVVGHPLDRSHGFGRWNKTIGDNGGGHYAGLFGGQGIVQTAR